MSGIVAEAQKTLADLKREEYVIGGVSINGGPVKRKYYAPDGRVKLAIPGMITRKGEGPTDRNLRDGWALTPYPEPYKKHCDGCDLWHDTEAQVKACIKKRKAFVARFNTEARREGNKLTAGSDEMDEMKDRLARLERLLERLVEGKANG